MAKLSLRKNNVILEELQSVMLASKLEERHAAEISADAIGESIDTFALPSSDGVAPSSDNNSVFLGVLSKFPSSDYLLAYAISEPSIYYHTLESNFGLKGIKLKNRILDELRNVRAIQPALDAIDYFESADKNLVCVIREDGMTMLNTLEQIKPFLGKRLPRIPLIEVSDVALMNLARANYGFAPEEITTIIYVGVEFTRLIFMKGSEFVHFAPVLGEGYDAPNIQNTVYSRLLLEQDNMGIPRIDKILLAGESQRITFDDFLRHQLPDVDVQYLRTPYIDTSNLPSDVQERVPEFAVPIATAWKVLNDAHPAFYRTNLLPESVREGQRTFKLAWHGYLLLVLVFLSTLYFTREYTRIRQDVSSKQQTLSQLQTRVAENEKLTAAIAEKVEQRTRYISALAVYDSLVPGSDRWNKNLAQLTKGVDDLKGMWITEIRAGYDGSMNITGYALYRARIPRIAALFDNSTLAKVEVKEIREKAPPVYNFLITVPPQKENRP
jgi:Tfp pilus assembly protein PilN